MVYLHDGSFESVLSGIYKMFYAKARVGEGKLLQASIYQPEFFELSLTLETDLDHAYKVAQKIHKQFGERGFKIVYNAYLSEDYSYGTVLFNALKFAFKQKGNGLNALGNQDVLKLNQLATKVSREAHLFLGLMRFRLLENDIYYADFEPSQNILPLLTHHFEDRFSDQVWVIHDRKRELAAFYNKSESHMAFLSRENAFKLSEGEEDWQLLWRRYCKDISIDARKNLKCQSQHMPKKYWRFLTEMNQ